MKKETYTTPNVDIKNKGISIFYDSDDRTRCFIHPQLSYPEFLQLISTILLHGMQAYLKAYHSGIQSANLNTKVEVNKKTARQTLLPEDAVLTESELKSAYLQASYAIHDNANLMLSNVLRMFLPDELAFLDPESLITEEAILNAELQALDAKLDELDETQKEIAKLRMETIKEDIKRNKDEYARMQLQDNLDKAVVEAEEDADKQPDPNFE